MTLHYTILHYITLHYTISYFTSRHPPEEIIFRQSELFDFVQWKIDATSLQILPHISQDVCQLESNAYIDEEVRK